MTSHRRKLKPKEDSFTTNMNAILEEGVREVI
jgi:hypothetical protein